MKFWILYPIYVVYVLFVEIGYDTYDALIKRGSQWWQRRQEQMERFGDYLADLRHEDLKGVNRG